MKCSNIHEDHSLIAKIFDNNTYKYAQINADQLKYVSTDLNPQYVGNYKRRNGCKGI